MQRASAQIGWLGSCTHRVLPRTRNARFSRMNVLEVNGGCTPARWNCAIVIAIFVAVLGILTPSGRAAPGVLAAYSFDEGSGTSVRDLSGNSPAGFITGASWTNTG